MEFLGIKFAPLNVPLKRRLETLAVTAAMLTITFLGLAGLYLLAYVIFRTRYWPYALIYATWAYVIDRDTCDKGGRRFEWVRGWSWWKYFRNYFPIRLTKSPLVELDPKQNYFFCCFPHGLLPTAVFSAFASNGSGFAALFPHHKPYPVTLKQNFYLPILRELLLALGVCSASEKSLNWILGTAQGGRAAALVVGGAAETLNYRLGQYRIVLRRRKGFVKIALQHGAALVPVFSFGETDIYDQVSNPKGSLLRTVQEWVKDMTGVAPVIPLGRGFFQYSFGIVPFRKPITTIVGAPIPVRKVEKPTQSQIDELHGVFIKKLNQLFEEHKHNYVENPEDVKLIID